MASTIAVVGDAGENNADTQSVAARVNAINPDRFIYLGDVYGNGTTTDGGEALDFTERFDPIFGSTAPVDLRPITLPVMGNHEWRPRATGFIPYWSSAQGAKGLPTTFPEIARYAVEVEGWRLIVMNTEETGGVDDGGGGVGQGMIWLDQQLDLAAGKAIVFGHRPRYSPGDVSADRGDQDDLGPMWDVLEGRCAAYVSGHTHLSCEMPAVGGTKQLLAGAGGAFFNAVDDASAAGAAAWGNNTDWAVLQLDLDGSSDVAAKWVKASDGSTLRSLTLTAPSVSPPASPPSPVDLTVSRAQTVHGGHNSSVNTLSSEIAFPSAPTAGQLLLSWVGIDKTSGTSPTPGAGWTLLEADFSPNVSYGLAYRIADGSANDQPSWSWTTASWCAYASLAYDVGDADVTLVGSDAVLQKSAVYEESRVYARSCATNPLTPTGAGGLAVAFCGVDSAEGDGSLSWDNSFTEIYEDDTYLDGGGTVAERVIEDGSPVLPTIFGLPGDQAVGAVALFDLALPVTGPQLKARVNGEWVDAALKIRVGGEWIDGTVSPA